MICQLLVLSFGACVIAGDVLRVLADQDLKVASEARLGRLSLVGLALVGLAVAEMVW